MNDLNLTDLLERVGERTHVGPPPVEDMVAGARRTRRRRTVMLTAAAAAAVAATVAGTAVLSAPGSNAPEQPTPMTSPSPAPSAPEVALAGTGLEGTWTVRALVGPDGRSVLPEPSDNGLRLTFADGEMTGSTGCNDVFGTYKQSGDKGQDLRFPHNQLGSTLVGCDDEPPLVSRLLDVRHVSGSADVRYLHADNWMIVAELREVGDVAGGDSTLPCPASEQRRTILDIPGPGRPTPEQAVAPFAGGQTTVADEQRDTALVHVIDPDGNVTRTFQVTKRDDGWWPDGYTECG